MNPSATGWFKKLLKEVSVQDAFFKCDFNDFYNQLRTCGFIYGSNVHCIHSKYAEFDLTEEELTKLNLALSLIYIYNNDSKKTDSFSDSIIKYYKAISEFKTSFLDELFGEKTGDELLEKIFHKRIHIDDNIITKNFNYFITNAVLFSDVLGYKQFLKSEDRIKPYLKKLESAIEISVYTALDTKEIKSDYDESLMKLFEASLRYKSNNKKTLDTILPFINKPLEKFYLIDILVMSLWDDKVIDKREKKFLRGISQEIEIEFDYVLEAESRLNQFYKKHKNSIALFNSKNPVQSFYDNSGKMVNKLIKRNKKRLIREIQESKELMYLISKSTTKGLTDDEQKKAQNQLIDIFKSIPSLAIFMLPGGMLLLPLVMKFIPKLLPSAFDDNRIEEK